MKIIAESSERDANATEKNKSDQKLSVSENIVRENNDAMVTNDNEQNSGNLYSVMSTLSGHTDRIVALAWNPHFSGQLMTGSFDNTVQVIRLS